MRVQCGERLLEVRRGVDAGVLELVESRLVVEVDAEDLRRFARRQVHRRRLRDPTPVAEHELVALGVDPVRHALRAAPAAPRGGRRRARARSCLRSSPSVAHSGVAVPPVTRERRRSGTKPRPTEVGARRSSSSKSDAPSSSVGGPRQHRPELEAGDRARVTARGRPARRASIDGHSRVCTRGVAIAPREQLLVLLVERRRSPSPTAVRVTRHGPRTGRRSPCAARPRPSSTGRVIAICAELLREALDQAAHEREIAVDPDEGHAPDGLAVVGPVERPA